MKCQVPSSHCVDTGWTVQVGTFSLLQSVPLGRRALDCLPRCRKSKLERTKRGGILMKKAIGASWPNNTELGI